MGCLVSDVFNQVTHAHAMLPTINQMLYLKTVKMMQICQMLFIWFPYLIVDGDVNGY